MDKPAAPKGGYIYLITNKVNGKKYVGQTIHLVYDRWKEHRRDAKDNKRTALHGAIRRYGADSFNVETIDKADTVEGLDEKEKFYIQKYETEDPDMGYNLKPGGQGYKETDPEILARRQAKKELNLEIRNQRSELKKLHYQLDREELQARLAAVKEGLNSSDPDVRKSAMLEYDLYYATKDMERAVATAEQSWAAGKVQREAMRARVARSGPILRSDGSVVEINEPRETDQEFIARKTLRVEILKERLTALKSGESKDAFLRRKLSEYDGVSKGDSAEATTPKPIVTPASPEQPALPSSTRPSASGRTAGELFIAEAKIVPCD